MNYLLKNRRRKFKKGLVITILVIIVFAFLSSLSPNLIPGKLNVIGKPFWQLRLYLNSQTSLGFNLLKIKADLIRENQELKSNLADLRVRLLEKDLLLKENEELKNLLGRSDETDFLLSRILSKPPQSPYDSLIIDIGENKGLIKGQEVYASDFVLIGKIDEVYSNTSKVKLFSAPGEEHEVEIGEENIRTTAIGLGGGNFEIKLPRGVDVKVGDQISSPSLNINMLGIIETIETKPQNPFQKILFKNPFNFSQTKWVQVKI
jgi:rod shape-determining protein MreC